MKERETREDTTGQPLVPLWPGLAVAALVGLVYLVFAGDGSLRFRPSESPHHVLIADAWLHGQLHVRQSALDELSAQAYVRERARAEGWFRSRGRPLTEDAWQRIRAGFKPSVLHDWSEIGGRYYGYWGPAPAALLLPYVAVAGLEASDRLAGALIGTLTVFLLYLVLRESARLRLPVTTGAASATALLLGLGTVHFYLSVAGTVWFLSQVVAVFFFTLAMWTVLRSDRSWWWATAAGAAFGASLLSRYSMVFCGIFFPMALIGLARETGMAWQRRALRLFVAFSVPVLLAGAVLLGFNYARFGSAVDTGLRSQIETGGLQRYKGDQGRYGTFSVHYVPHNAYTYLVNPTLRRNPWTGDVTFDPEGNSLFLVTPALALAFLSIRRRHFLLSGAWAGVAVSFAVLLCFFATGYYTFGNRYALDFIPLMLLPVAVGMPGRRAWVVALLIGISIVVNLWGTFRFLYEMPW